MKWITLLALVSITACTRQDHTASETIALVLLTDTTDARAQYPDECVVSLFHLKHGTDSPALFRLTTISDRQTVPAIECRLGSRQETEQENTEQDPNHRKRACLAFQNKVRTAIRDFRSTVPKTALVKNSECFRSIIAELLRLQQYPATKRVLFVYSDLQECSAIFNAYDKASRELLLSNPEKVAQLFEKTGVLPDALLNTTMHVIYTPTSRADDALFRGMCNVYDQLLSKRGITLNVQANFIKDE